MGYILPSKSPNKNKTLWFCVDYCKVNAARHQRAHVTQDTVQDLRYAMVFSTHDLKSGYWQISMDKNSRYITAFPTPDENIMYLMSCLLVGRTLPPVSRDWWHMKYRPTSSEIAVSCTWRSFFGSHTYRNFRSTNFVSKPRSIILEKFLLDFLGHRVKIVITAPHGWSSNIRPRRNARNYGANPRSRPESPRSVQPVVDA